MPSIESDEPAKKRRKSYPISSFHVDIVELQAAQGKLHLFVTIDRTSNFERTGLHGSADK